MDTNATLFFSNFEHDTVILFPSLAETIVDIEIILSINGVSNSIVFVSENIKVP